MKVRYAVLIDGSFGAAEVRDVLGLNPEPWVVVRWEKRLRIVWSLVSRGEVERAVDGIHAKTPLVALLLLEARIETPTVQLATLNAGVSFESGAVVLDRKRFFGIVEPAPPAFREMMGEGPLFKGNVGVPLERGFTGAPGAPGRGGPTLPAGPAASLTQPSAPPPTTLEAYPFVSAPLLVEAKGSVILQIGLKESQQAGTGDGAMTLKFPGETIDLQLDVVAPDFECEKGWRRTLTIPVDDPFAPRIKLSLTAPSLPAGTISKAAAIAVHYSYGGAHCGFALRPILVHDGTVTNANAEADPGNARVRIESDGPTADLTVLVAWKNDNEASGVLLWTFETPHAVSLPEKALCKPIGLSAASFARKVLQEVSTRDFGPQIGITLEGIGKEIGGVVPPDFWKVFRDVTAAVRKKEKNPAAVPTVLLKSAESHIPWELAKVPEDSRVFAGDERPPFLTTQCVMGRWVLDPAIPSPPSRIEVRNLVVVYGEYLKAQALPQAIEESKLLQTYKATPYSAREADVLAILERKLPEFTPDRDGLQVLHFATHGESSPTDDVASTILLNDGTTISATAFLGARMIEKDHPFIFLNACQVGAAAPVLGRYGGFAGSCVSGGCTAVIAPLWSVNDVVALEIAGDFYEHVLGKPTATTPEATISAAEALFKIRKKALVDIKVKVKKGGAESEELRPTATPMAYVFYGHPELKLERV